jgi:hypothetical protein
VYDPLFDRMIVYGGLAENPSGSGAIRLDVRGTTLWMERPAMRPVPLSFAAETAPD